MSYRDDSFRLRRERDEALKDVQYFRSSLIDKDRTCIELEDELLRSKQVSSFMVILNIFSVQSHTSQV